MNEQETVKVLAAVQSLWPNFMNGRDPDLTVKLWAFLFADEPAELVKRAVLAYAAKDVTGFAPMPGALKEQISIMTDPEIGMTAMQAWARLHHSIAHEDVFYSASQVFDNLPEDIRAVVGTPAMLREWGMMDSQEIQTVVASNFMKNYTARKKAAKDAEKLPMALADKLPGMRLVGLEGGLQAPQTPLPTGKGDV